MALSLIRRFMEERDFHLVCNNMRLSNGAIFPLPIFASNTQIESKN